ncbi:tyrosine-type recombinase/integrase [Methylomonas rapida]|uniref:Tyrosine-type recombinase/integrase n=1 Tax=Methylomonas rapida TaxID=2963939 RepID=A0ABY7GGT6_9GAMM|nr:tyrosine-type recombinase/integrase [Methylomonas rapida]WAR43375.1 tyrosine-type recombinase/integrase [Methylomonas rapida]
MGSFGKAPSQIRITPHIFCHTLAVHLLEAGVEVNVIRGWLGHVSLNTTNRYAEITIRTKADALELCEPVVANVGAGHANLRGKTMLECWPG